MSHQSLVLDANILIRAVLGRRVFNLLNNYCSTTAFFAPDDAFADAVKYLPPIFEARGIDWGLGVAALSQLSKLVQCIESDVYGEFEAKARQRIRATFVIGRFWLQRWPWAAQCGRRIRISSAAVSPHGPLAL
jgi:hypothetical protein